MSRKNFQKSQARAAKQNWHNYILAVLNKRSNLLFSSSTTSDVFLLHHILFKLMGDYQAPAELVGGNLFPLIRCAGGQDAPKVETLFESSYIVSVTFFFF